MKRAALLAQALRFGLVGFLGLAVNIAVVYLIRPFVALQLSGALAFLAAASSTWFLHRKFTFRGASAAPPRRQWGFFIAANTVGGSIYYAIFWFLVTRNQNCHAHPFIAICIGGAAAMVVNFTLSRSFVFRTGGVQASSSAAG